MPSLEVSRTGGFPGDYVDRSDMAARSLPLTPPFDHADINYITVREVLKAEEELKNAHRQLWDTELGNALSSMMAMAGYTDSAAAAHRRFFARHVASSLAAYPVEPTPRWMSFMTDDHTPAELSWAWSGDERLPAVRYSVEPIGWDAGSVMDPYNTQATAILLGNTLPYAPSLDLLWYRHFLQCLTLQKKKRAFPADNFIDAPPSTCNPPSQTFIAFDLEHNEDMVVKYYFMPTLKAASLGASKLEMTEAAIRALRLRDGPTSSSLSDSFSLLTEYMETFPAGTITVEIVAVDCVTPSKSRVKIYVRSRQTTFASVLDMLTLGQRLNPLSESAVSSLEELWVGFFGTPDGGAQVLERPLPEKPHCTAGILYYFELKPDSPFPTSKVYLPVRHYAQNDEQIARSLSQYLEKRGKGLADGMTYLEGVRKLCKHRELRDGLGFHTYITAAVKNLEVAVNSYLNPELYHPCRMASRGTVRATAMSDVMDTSKIKRARF